MKLYYLLFIILLSLPANSLTINDDVGISMFETTIYKKPDLKSPVVGQLTDSETFVAKSITCVNSRENFNNCFVEIEKNGNITGWVQRWHIFLNIKSNKNKHPYKNIDTARYQKLIGNDATVWIAVSEYDSQYNRCTYAIILANRKVNKLICSFESEKNLKLFEYRDINSDSRRELIVETYSKAPTDVTTASTLNIYEISDTAIINLFKVNTSYSSHEFDIYLNSVHIANNTLHVSKLFFGKGIYHENGRETFGTFWTLPVKTNEIIYTWDKQNSKYTISGETISKEIICYSDVDNLRLRANPTINSPILKNLKKGDRLLGVEITEPYPCSKLEGNPPLHGYWLKVKTQDGKTGWAFSYFMKFEKEFINHIMKYQDPKAGQGDCNFIRMNLVTLD